MRFETIVLLIIAFNVVTAILQRRAKAKKAREAQERAARGTARPEAEPAEPEAFGEEDEAEWDPRPTARREEPSRPAREMPSLGRDILDQIARDLGLRRPKPAPSEPWGEEPEPVIVAERPEPRPEPVRAPPMPAADRPVGERPYAAPRAAEVSAFRAAPSTAAGVAKRGVSRESPAVRKVPSATPVPRVNLRDPAKLREAFILKEVLGEPLSRRGR